MRRIKEVLRLKQVLGLSDAASIAQRPHRTVDSKGISRPCRARWD